MGRQERVGREAEARVIEVAGQSNWGGSVGSAERERRREIRQVEQEAVVATSLAGLGATLPFLALALDRSTDVPLVLVVLVVLAGLVLGGVGLARSMSAYRKLRRLRPGRGLRGAIEEVLGSRANLTVLGIIVALLAVVVVAR